jgi:hypothetical protein
MKKPRVEKVTEGVKESDYVRMVVRSFQGGEILVRYRFVKLLSLSPVFKVG